eukprot:3741984-Rhodomonas_salina.1
MSLPRILLPGTPEILERARACAHRRALSVHTQVGDVDGGQPAHEQLQLRAREDAAAAQEKKKKKKKGGGQEKARNKKAQTPHTHKRVSAWAKGNCHCQKEVGRAKKRREERVRADMGGRDEMMRHGGQGLGSTRVC